MKKETFNHTATAKILYHTEHKEEVLEARDLYIASESIKQANNSLKLPEREIPIACFVPKEPAREEDGISDNLNFLEAHFSKEGEGIKLCIGCTTYRILGDYVTVETALSSI